MEKQICKYCGKPYRKNEKVLEFLPEFIKEKVRYIPDCDCLEKIKEKELEELEKKRVQECIKNRIKRYKDISVIDKKFNNSKFENADMRDKHMIISKKFAEKFIERGTAPQGIIFYGGVGVGKTFASNCIANFLMDRGKTVLVMNLGLYLSKLKREWSEAEKDVLDYVKTCDLLILDDFGVEKSSEFVIEKVFSLIDTRYRTEKPMIVTSNLNLEEIENKFGSRIADRIGEMCFQLSVIGKSKRINKSKTEFLEFIA